MNNKIIDFFSMVSFILYLQAILLFLIILLILQGHFLVFYCFARLTLSDDHFYQSLSFVPTDYSVLTRKSSQVNLATSQQAPRLTLVSHILRSLTSIYARTKVSTGITEGLQKLSKIKFFCNRGLNQDT